MSLEAILCAIVPPELALRNCSLAAEDRSGERFETRLWRVLSFLHRRHAIPRNWEFGEDRGCDRTTGLFTGLPRWPWRCGPFRAPPFLPRIPLLSSLCKRSSWRTFAAPYPTFRRASW